MLQMLVYLLYYFCVKRYIFQDSLMNRKFKRKAFIEKINIFQQSLLSLLINLTDPCWIKYIYLVWK